MENDVNHLDPNDEGLKEIFGSRFHDATQDEVPPKQVQVKKPTRKPVDAQWEPAKPNPDWLDKLKDCVKWVFLFGGLSCLVFYWQGAGLMDPSIAVPTMCACTALAGVGVGKNLRRA
jgi:hypothetical protein